MESDMEALEQFLRTEAEPLQYAAFFGSLVILGFLELAISRSRAAPCRGRRWSINFGLTALNILILGAIPVSGVFVADYARDHGYGLLNVLSVSALLALPIGILVRSLLSWAIHLAMHKIPLFWRVHRLHHTDPVLDISTTVRFHPLEFLIATPVLLLAILAVGISPTALMAYEIFDAVMAVFSHANIRVPSSIERILRLVLVPGRPSHPPFVQAGRDGQQLRRDAYHLGSSVRHVPGKGPEGSGNDDTRPGGMSG
jgi:sterol desaturase/sphingolipid hydroxylase (fatty acid hydroxylase superfamily)